MGQASFKIGGNSYTVACGDGEEDHLLNLAEKVDAKAEQVIRTVGNVSEVRQLLLIAILLADELNDAQSAVQLPAVPIITARDTYDPEFAELAPFVERLEALATKLELSRG